jgi:hypothetical protein
MSRPYISPKRRHSYKLFALQSDGTKFIEQLTVTKLLEPNSKVNTIVALLKYYRRGLDW